MVKHNFELQQDKRDLSSLKNHIMVETMGYLKPDDLYISDVKFLGVYKRPIITDDGYVLTLPDYVDAARKAGVLAMEVLVLTGANSNDLLRIINFESRPWYRASKAILYKSIKVLQDHLWNTEEGRLWRESIEGEGVNEVIGYLVGYSASTVSLVKSIGNADYSLLDQIDDPESGMTLTKAQQVIKDNADLEAKKDKLEHVNLTNLPDVNEGDDDLDDDFQEGDGSEGDNDGGEGGDKDNGTTGDPEPAKVKQAEKAVRGKKPAKQKVNYDVPLTSFSVGLGRYGDFTLDLKTGRPAMLYNDAFLGNVSISDKGHNNPAEGLHYVVQSVDVDWSFQVIATRITNIVKEEEVCGKQA
jgi:hypothetical protein